jgi:hypothetical protein
VPDIQGIDQSACARDEVYKAKQRRWPGNREVQMAGDVVNVLLLGMLALGSIVCIFGPLAVLSVMFWKWHKELRQTARLRLARTTQTK